MAAAVPQPGGAAGQTVVAAWIARAEDPQRPGRPAMGDLGGGSDHVAFLCHAGHRLRRLLGRRKPGHVLPFRL